MSLGLLLPLGLFALAGVLVPLLIHLIRQPEHKVIDFPALRWLRESMRPRRRLRFDDPWLLVLRVGLLALLALLLAMPVLNGDWRGPRHWIALGDGVDLDAARRALAGTTAGWRWLAPGFPAVDGDRPASPQPFASLLGECDASLSSGDQLTVLVPAELDGLDAERIRLVHAVDWRVVAARGEAKAGITETPRHVALRHDSDHARALHYLRAALAAWESSEAGRWRIDDQPVGAAGDPGTDWLIWVGRDLPDALIPWIERGGRVLHAGTATPGDEIVWRDAAGISLASERRVGAGRVISLLQPLTPASVPELFDAGFPARLRSLLEGKPAAPTRALADGVRPLQVESAPIVATTSLLPILGLLIALVFLAERFMATRKRGVP